ncbi:MAG: selenium cofactor biosynthesis protein YqeC [Rubrobacteraceae bacterium]
MKLYSALGIIPGDIVAFAGAGGKSGAILDIATDLVEEGLKVLVAPTTKMFLGETEKIGPLVTSEDLEELRRRVEDAYSGAGAVVAGSGLLSGERIGGVDPAWIPTLATPADVVLVEADGSRRHPLKGTADHEPLLPDGTTLVVAVGSILALGTPVDEEHVHRPELFSELTGIGAGHTITADAIARAMAQGSLGRVPPDIRRAALITGVSPGRLMSDASAVAHELWHLGLNKVVLTSLPQESPGQIWMS